MWLLYGFNIVETGNTYEFSRTKIEWRMSDHGVVAFTYKFSKISNSLMMRAVFEITIIHFIKEVGLFQLHRRFFSGFCSFLINHVHTQEDIDSFL